MAREAWQARLGPIAIALSGFLLISAGDAVVKWLSSDYGLVQLGWARYVFTLPILMLAPQWQPRRILTVARLSLQMLRSALLIAATLFMFVALRRMSQAEANAIGFSSTILVAVFSTLVLGERVPARRWVAIAVGAIGLLVIVRPGTGVFSWDALYPLGMAVCFALYQVLTRLVRETDALTSLFYSALAGVVVLSLAAPFAWRAPDLAGWFALAAIGLSIGLGHLLLIRALQAAPASSIAPYAYSQILWATLLGAMIHGTVPDGWTIAGAAILVGSGLFLIMEPVNAAGSAAARAGGRG